MMTKSHLVLALACLLLPSFAVSSVVANEPRSALVIGFDDNPTSTIQGDARATADALRQLDFQVTFGNNPDSSQIQTLLNTFKLQIAAGGVGLFYYAGHGAQINGVNYLRPRGATLTTLDDVKTKWFNLDAAFSVLDEAPLRVRLVFLDACRDNPVLAKLAPQDADGDVWIKGLAEPMHPPRNAFISYATGPGQIARDAGGREHSPYTTALLKYIRQPGLPLDEFSRLVGTYVEGATADDQQPWINSSFRPEFFFRETAYILAHIDFVDDELLVLLNGQEAISSSNAPPGSKKLALRSGINSLEVQIYNQHSFTGGVDLSDLNPHLPQGPGHLPEGWRYSLTITTATGQPLAVLKGCENQPQKNGPHHGHTFSAATAQLLVDDLSGSVTSTAIDPNVWMRDPGSTPPCF